MCVISFQSPIFAIALHHVLHILQLPIVVVIIYYIQLFYNLIIVFIVSKNSPTSYLSHNVIVQLRNCEHTTKFTQTLFVQNKLQPNHTYNMSSECTIPINPS